jgi:glycosyltransferase 2 family protein
VHALSGNRGKALVAVLGVALSAFFLWLAVRNADLDAVGDALADAQPGYVLLAVLAVGVGYTFQSVRWRQIADAPQLRLRAFYGMLLGGLACNNVLPVRIGEFLRAGWLSRDAPMPGGRAFGSVVLDRICDVVTIVVFFAISLQVAASAEWLVRLAVGALLAVVAIAGALVLARVYTTKRHARTERTPRGRVMGILRDTVVMLGEPIGRHRAARWIGLSACAWGLSALASGLVARSVGIELTPLEAVFLTSALALGVAIPSSPGYIGTYQWLGVAALGLLDVPVEQALAFSILMHASWYVPTTLAGGVFIGVRALRGKPVHETGVDLG